MKTLKILYAMLLAFTVGFGLYTEHRLDELHYGIKDTREKHFRLEADVQANYRHIKMLQKKVYSDMIAEGEMILMQKLDVEFHRIHFVQVHYSVDKSEIKAIEYMISGNCSSDTENYTCESFIVDVKTGVISKF